jgi:hypothetical protein
VVLTKEKIMNEIEAVLDRLGVVAPLDWTVDAVQLIDDKRSPGWLLVVLAWDNAQQRFIVCDIAGNDGEVPGKPSHLSEPISSGDVARMLYVNRVAARLFRLYNSKAPSLAFGLPNEEDLT